MNDKPARCGKYVRRLAVVVGLAVCGLITLTLPTTNVAIYLVKPDELSP